MAGAPVQDLILLGLLMDQARHGYEIRQVIAQFMSDIAKISPGTIYYTLRKLEKRGLITSSSERRGRMPERRVYEITSDGRAEFNRILEQSVLVEERPYFAFDAALYFFRHMPAELLSRAIDEKLERIDTFKQRLEKLEQDYPGEWPFHYEALRYKARLLSEANEKWFAYLREALEKEKEHGAA